MAGVPYHFGISESKNGLEFREVSIYAVCLR